MSATMNASSTPAPAADHGCLPAWEPADLPEPLPFNVRNALKTIGPGAILLAAAIGGGEWIIGPMMVVKYGAGILWIGRQVSGPCDIGIPASQRSGPPPRSSKHHKHQQNQAPRPSNGPAMHLSDLKQMHVTELVEMAQANEIIRQRLARFAA